MPIHIGLLGAMPEEVTDQIIDLIGCNRGEILEVSAKTGQGIEKILDSVIDRIPHPKGDPESQLQAMIFDSVYNPFRGIETYFRVKNGSIKKDFLCAAPNMLVPASIRITFFFGSANSVRLKLCFSTNVLCLSTESTLIPIGCAFKFLYFSRL